MSLRAFEEVVGREHVREIPGASLDGVPVIAEISPGTPDEVAACLRVAGETAQPLVSCGGGSKLAVGNRSSARNLTRLSVARLLGPLDLQPEEGIAIAAAGVPLSRVRENASSVGVRTLLDDPNPGATVGGSVAADAFSAGLRADRRPRDELLGIQVALPCGTLARAGGRVVKNVTGFDLVRLHCGAYGTLGVITELTFRLRPLPEAQRALVRQLRSSDEAFRLAGELRQSGVEPDGVMVHSSHGVAELLWRLEGSGKDVRERASRFEGEGAEPGVWPKVEELLVTSPRDGHARVRMLGRASDTGSLWSWLDENGVPVLALPLVGIVIGDLEERRAAAAVRQAREAGMTIVVERASSPLKARLETFGLDPGVRGLMQTLKLRFDPQGVLAPGRLLSEAAA